MSQPKDLESVKQVADALNRFIGSLHAAACTWVIWISQANRGQYSAASKYGMQLSFGFSVLTLRKFEDLWKYHLNAVIVDDGERALGEALLGECQQRKLRTTANRLIAHYAPGKSDLPLSSAEIAQLIHDNGWATEEEALDWFRGVIPRLMSIRDHIMQTYSIVSLSDDIVKA